MIDPYGESLRRVEFRENGALTLEFSIDVHTATADEAASRATEFARGLTAAGTITSALGAYRVHRIAGCSVIPHPRGHRVSVLAFASERRGG